MKVTNKHVVAIRDLSCAFFQVTSPEKGPKIGFWTFGKIVGIAYNPDGGTTEISSCDLAADLIEARELIKKALFVVKNLQPCGCDNDRCKAARIEREWFLNRAKEYE